MPDVFANITAAPPQALETISSVLELRASLPQQQEMLRTYLRDIDFPDRARVLEIGCGTGPVARVLATWPKVEESPRAHRVLCPGGWLAVCDGDFATATLSTGDLDPLQVCVDAFVEGFVNDRWMVRRMSRLAAAAGFAVSPLRSYGLVETEKPGLTATWVDRGADLLVSRGQIDQALAAALKAEAKRRAETHTFFGYMAFGGAWVVGVSGGGRARPPAPSPAPRSGG